MNIVSLSASQLRRAATIKDQIAKLETKLSQLLGSSIKSTPIMAPKKKSRRKMSAAAKAKMAKAAKARWAKVKAAGKKKL